MPREIPGIFKNKKWRKEFYDDLHKPSAEIMISEKSLDLVYQAFADAYHIEFHHAREQLSKDRSYYALIPGRGKYYLSGFIAQRIRHCQFMLIGQQDQHKKPIYEFFYKLIIAIVKAFYHDIHQRHLAYDTEQYTEFWEFIEESIRESIALNFDAEVVMKDEAVSNLYSLYNRLMYNNHSMKQFTDIQVMSLLNIQLSEYLRSAEPILNVAFCTSHIMQDKEGARETLQQQTKRLHGKMRELHEINSASIAGNVARARFYYALLSSATIIALCYLLKPELTALYFYHTVLAFAIISTISVLRAYMSSPRVFSGKFLDSEFSKALTSEHKLVELCQILNISHSGDELEILVKDLGDTKRNLARSAEVNFYHVGICFLIAAELIKGAYRFRHQEIQLAATKEKVIVYSAFNSANHYHIPEYAMPANKKAEPALMPSLSPKPVEPKVIKHKFKLSDQQKQDGALIQGADDTNQASAIYVRLPQPQSKQEDEFNKRIKEGRYSFVSGKGKQGFKYNKTTETYRFKLFDQQHTRWNFIPEGHEIVRLAEGVEKSIPRFSFCSRDKK